MSASIIEEAEKHVIDWWSIPEEELVIPRDILEKFGCFDDVDVNALMSDRGEEENIEPQTKQEKMESVTSCEQLGMLSKGFVPSNTKVNTEWSILEWRNRSVPSDSVPIDILSCTDAVVLNKWLSLYVTETRRMDGKKFSCTYT